MSQQEEDKLDKLIKMVDKMNRGLYGDADNKVPGLMQAHYELHSDVVKLKENEKKKAWMAAGTSVTLPLIVMWFKEKLGL